MDKQRIQYLHHQYLTKNLSVAELAEWETLLGDDTAISILQILLETNWEKMESQDLIQLNQNRSVEILEYIKSQPQSVLKMKPGFRFALTTAAAALLLITCLIWYVARDQPAKNPVYGSDIKPGKNSATLTLASGQKIKLSEAVKGELAQEAGVIISKTPDGQLVYELKEAADALTTKPYYNTLTTANGEAYHLRLPDGTLVFLNAASTLKYPVRFKGRERKVELSGEGYFEVSPNKTQPFLVKTAQQEVEVLGTHFNINSYPDEEETKTTLLEGAVKVSDLNSRKSGLLKPGQQSSLKSGILAITKADEETTMAWTKGDFIFKQEDFRITMRRIARWYDVQVIYEPGAPEKVQLGGWVSRKNNISAVLEMMESTGKVHFKIEGRRIIVSK
jgi:transmembrane sensor